MKRYSKQKPPKIGQFVKVDHSRGYGDGMYSVKSVADTEAVICQGKEKSTVYIAHLYADAECFDA